MIPDATVHLFGHTQQSASLYEDPNSFFLNKRKRRLSLRENKVDQIAKPLKDLNLTPKEKKVATEFFSCYESLQEKKRESHFLPKCSSVEVKSRRFSQLFSGKSDEGRQVPRRTRSISLPALHAPIITLRASASTPKKTLQSQRNNPNRSTKESGLPSSMPNLPLSRFPPPAPPLPPSLAANLSPRKITARISSFSKDQNSKAINRDYLNKPQYDTFRKSKKETRTEVNSKLKEEKDSAKHIPSFTSGNVPTTTSERRSAKRKLEFSDSSQETESHPSSPSLEQIFNQVTEHADTPEKMENFIKYLQGRSIKVVNNSADSVPQNRPDSSTQNTFSPPPIPSTPTNSPVPPVSQEPAASPQNPAATERNDASPEQNNGNNPVEQAPQQAASPATNTAETSSNKRIYSIHKVKEWCKKFWEICVAWTLSGCEALKMLLDRFNLGIKVANNFYFFNYINARP